MNAFKQVLEGTVPDSIPVWFMRQAGRYLPGYTEARKSRTIKEMCMDPALLVKLMEEPINKLGVDAAIVFFDILLPLEAMGVTVDFADGTGPVVQPAAHEGPYASLLEFDQREMKYPLIETVRKFKEMHTDIPLIGFSGGPVTMLSYLLSGGADRDMTVTKRAISSNEHLFRENMALLTEMIIALLKMQIRAGADVVQIFDSWAGFFSPYQYNSLMKKYLSEIVSELSPLKRKVIYFSIATSGIVPQIVESGVDYISADWRSRLSLVDSIASGKVGLQGNLDPTIAASSPTGALMETGQILNDISYKQDYIFNLGHGVLPNTDYRTLQEIVRMVHDFRRRS
ncbi:MAG: uroporphyrinogen decarboxylase [Thermoplasmataceae archaeon]